ncbi:putative nonribosomal peptide synthase [Phaeosphaeriaceae sp. PMI808]|nr:putative nonribosomal peptide synthase [Phaeosphaeriaceae sp. PMI808]
MNAATDEFQTDRPIPHHAPPSTQFSKLQTLVKTERHEYLDATVVDRFDEQAIKTPDRIAAEFEGHNFTYSSLRNASLHVSRALLLAGVKPRTKIPLLTQMSLEMLPAIIGILRVGACYCPMDVAAWSGSRVEAALYSVSSSIALVTCPCPDLKLPAITVNFQNEWMSSHAENVSDLEAQLHAIRVAMRHDDLAWCLFTSGTTGKPKGVMVYHRAVHAYSHVDIIGDGDLPTSDGEGFRCLLAFSVGFDGCASVIWGTLTKGHTLLMALPSSFPYVAAECDVLMLTPSMLAVLDPSGPYERVRYILLGAEDPSLDVVRRWVTPNRKVFNTYGPSETTCIISLGEIDPDVDQITFGKLNPGVKVVLVDEELQECDHGEVLITGPGLAAGYMNNTNLTNQKFIQWHGKRFYRTGDLARRTKKGELTWAGRADSMIKNRGFLINLETEVEPALLSFPTVQLAVALKCQDRLVGYVHPADVDTEQLRAYLKGRYDPFIIPDDLIAIDKFPLSINGKVDRNALREQREEQLDLNGEKDLIYDDHIEAKDVLRMAFSKSLHINISELDEDSSFIRLGGNSFAAIRLTSLLKKHGYMVSPVQILRADTIGQLEGVLKSSAKVGPETDEHSKEVPVTGVQSLYLTRSMKNPLPCALINISKYVGDRDAMPTPNEFHDAFIKATSAHSIFQTRFDLKNFTLSDLGQLNLTWHTLNVSESEFEEACIAAEAQAWEDINTVGPAEIEVPFFHITCVSVPDRKALAIITRVHHVLLDVISQVLLSQDVERALAGEEILTGPRIEDFARFMQKHKTENLDKAITMFEKMVEKLPATSILQPPSPRNTPRAHDVMLLDSPVSIRKSALDAAARELHMTNSTMMYAAWALFLSSITQWDQVGFCLSLSGRTVPWPDAPFVIGGLVDSAPFSVAIPTHITVHEWLAQVHTTTLNVLEFDGLGRQLPPALTEDKRTNLTSIVCLLDIPNHPTPSWEHIEKQKHNDLMGWTLGSDSEDCVVSIFDFQVGRIDEEWAKEVAGIPGQMLDALVNAKRETLVADLLRYPTALLQARGALL